MHTVGWFVISALPLLYGAVVVSLVDHTGPTHPLDHTDRKRTEVLRPR